MPSVLIIDDEVSLLNSLRFALEEDEYQVSVATTGAAGLQSLRDAQPDIVLLDLKLPDRTGLDILDDILQSRDPPHVIMISAHGDTRAAVRAVKSGAADYLTKPFDLTELLHLMRSVLSRGRMAEELQFRRSESLYGSTGVGASKLSHQLSLLSLLGSSDSMNELNATIKRVAASTVMRVLVLGESGTGKALVARALHAGSQRAAGPFIEINCASLPEQLIEAELFGAEKGAYTGAHSRRVGLVALADKGTLFLDEIGETPLALQAKLLHFLENGSYRPIGGGNSQSADVRVVAATNRDLAAEVVEGGFREDLYYRLNVISLRLPPLRERHGDVEILADYFATLYAAQEKVSPVRFEPWTLKHLAAYQWPGNVRELKNLIERFTILHPGTTINIAALPMEITMPSNIEPFANSLQKGGSAQITDTLANTERKIILNALRECGGHKSQAAGRLGISRHAFKRRLQRLGLK
ncbi:sigma-54-dependent transcriptional regulator [Massilia sp. CMS3.1]|uniref:sigma-54-dependent transcriptional regulator n=1 Tax=Massilia sp. CMS3.1 TaxID=3373083 RepID=UPI003EE44FF7